MSAARTARRRRKQIAAGARGLEQVYGKRRTPHYPGAVSKEKSASQLRRALENARKGIGL